MAKLILLVGPPGCGKSTMATQLETEGYVRINQDSQGKEGHWDKYLEALAKGKDIVVDRMNFNKQQRSRYLSIASLNSVNYETEIRVLHEPLEVCFRRCLQREGHETIQTEVDARKALLFFFKNYERVEDSEEALITRIWPHAGRELPSAIICDLDGTLCDISHRQKWVTGEGKKNWPMFMAGIKDDALNKWCKTILMSLHSDYHIVLCSGRGQEHLEPTRHWLSQNQICHDNLFMRMNGDHRQDYIVKEILLDFEILSRYRPYFMIDDRQQVVDMYRRRGYTVLQCAKGDF